MRILIPLLVSLAVITAPVGAAMAVKGDAAPAMSGMADCPGHAKDASADQSGDCACCDTTKAPCQADLCLAKCFKLIGKIEMTGQELIGSAAIDRFIEPEKPPNWAPEPLPHPPRT